MTNCQSLGGKIRGQQEREEAIKNYNLNPVVCLNCGKPIPVLNNDKVSTVSKKKFCNHSCAASYNNRKYIKRNKIEKEKQDRNDLRRQEVLNKTKGELFAQKSTWQAARTSIQSVAQSIYINSSKPKQCVICGYDKHYDVAHIKSVSSFDDSSKVSEIDNIDNLIALCPNHHWEYDHGLLNISNYMKDKQSF